jgi:acetyl-CoA carboxylase biotin carboxyl carrier protein
MDFEDIERILEMVRQHELVEFELERDGWKLRLRKASATFQVLPPQMQPAPIPVTPVGAAPVAAAPVAAAPAPPAAETPLLLALVQ